MTKAAAFIKPEAPAQAVAAAEDQAFEARMNACEQRAEVVLDDDFDMEDGE